MKLTHYIELKNRDTLSVTVEYDLKHDNVELLEVWFQPLSGKAVNVTSMVVTLEEMNQITLVDDIDWYEMARQHRYERELITKDLHQ